MEIVIRDNLNPKPLTSSGSCKQSRVHDDLTYVPHKSLRDLEPQ